MKQLSFFLFCRRWNFNLWKSSTPKTECSPTEPIRLLSSSQQFFHRSVCVLCWIFRVLWRPLLGRCVRSCCDETCLSSLSCSVSPQRPLFRREVSLSQVCEVFRRVLCFAVPPPLPYLSTGSLELIRQLLWLSGAASAGLRVTCRSELSLKVGRVDVIKSAISELLQLLWTSTSQKHGVWAPQADAELIMKLHDGQRLRSSSGTLPPAAASRLSVFVGSNKAPTSGKSSTLL